MATIPRNNTNFPVQLFEYLKNVKHETKYDFLTYYQNIVRIFINEVNVQSKGLLVYHEMGVGKSILAVALAIDNIQKMKPVLLLAKSLQRNMSDSIKKYIKLRTSHDPTYRAADNIDAWIEENFSFVSMNAGNMLRQMSKAAEGTASAEFDAIMEQKFGEVLKLGSLNDTLLIVDEAHNLFRAITNGSKNAIGMYDMVMRSKSCKILFLTGTPIANNPFETASCFNMLAGVIILPEDYREFYKLFVDEKTGLIKNKEKYQNRIMGLVSRVSRNTKPGAAIGYDAKASTAKYPAELPIIVERVKMDENQYVNYQLAREKEKEETSKKEFGPRREVELASMVKPKSSKASTYRVHSRQLSNYCPPPAFKSEKDPAVLPETSLSSPKFDAILRNINKHHNQLGLVYSQFIGMGGLGTFARFLEHNGWERIEVDTKKVRSSSPLASALIDVEPQDIIGGGPEVPSIDNYLQHIEMEASQVDHGWWEGSAEPEILRVKAIRYATTDDLDALRMLSETFDERYLTHPYYTIALDDGNIIAFVVVFGHKIVEEHLNNLPSDINADSMRMLIKDAIRGINFPTELRIGIVGGVDTTPIASSKRPKGPLKFAVISGDVSVEARAQLQEIYNSDANKHGSLIDLLLVSSTGAEGLDLKNGRHVHVMEPYWTWGRILQIIARLVRSNSHVALPEDEANVQPYIYLSVPAESAIDVTSTTDVELYEESRSGMMLINSFAEAIAEVSIECMINGEASCRTCSPTNQQLFTNDILKDMRSVDPCTKLVETTISAQSITVNGVDYYYVPDSESIFDYKIFALDEKLNGYKQLPESNPLVATIVDAIEKLNVAS